MICTTDAQAVEPPGQARWRATDAIKNQKSKNRKSKMKPAWHFSKVNPRFKNREATQGEFFANDTELRAFVREAVQNSLDASRPGHYGPVSIRIFVSGDESALAPETAKRYFKGGWDHFHAEGSGLREAPAREDRCRFITYEDSGTTGLTGDIDQYHEVADVRNPFYYFFRAEGQSNKLESGRGRWGLGKFVFPRSSRIRSFFAVTVRHDDHQRLLVGQSILRSHPVEDKSYTPDGWFGEKPDRNEASLPVDDQDFIDQFEHDFCLERRREPGLSIVVPFCNDSWTLAAVIGHVVQDYFYPILQEELIVTVEDSDSQTILNARTLPEIVNNAGDDVRSVIRPLVDLSGWALKQQSSGSLVVLSSESPKGTPKWSAQSIDPDVFSRLRRAFNYERRLAVRIPVLVQCRSGQSRDSHFDVFLERAEGSQQKRPVFIRDGIIISDVRTRLIRDVHAIVSIDDAPLTAFLGDAENPAHTAWHEESSHFKGKYTNGPATLRFIRNAVADLCQMLAEATEDEDPELLLDVFSVGTLHDQAGLPVNFASMTTHGFNAGRDQLDKLPRKSKQSKAFRLTRRAGGFRIAGHRNAGEHQCRIDVLVAYDRRSGSPLRKYSTTDFRLDQRPIEIEAHGAEVTIPEPNRLIVAPTNDAFEVIVTGFDENRDLFLQSRMCQDPVAVRNVRK